MALSSNSSSNRRSARGRNVSSESSSSGSSSNSSFERNGADTTIATSLASTSSPASTTSTVSVTSAKTSTARPASPSRKQHAAVAAAYTAGVKRVASSIATSNNKSTTSSIRQTSASLQREERRLTVDDYQSEIIEHMSRMERDTIACVDLMDAQPELRWYMRPYLVDFIIEIHQTFRLRPETLFLTMNIVDRYASKRIVYKRHYQLVGCAALLIAAKFEDAKDKVPLVSELVQMCCSAYDESAFTQMEGHVLSTIGWILGFPTPEAYLRLTMATSDSAKDRDNKIQSIARFLLEITLFTRDFVGALPSTLATACLCLARYIASNGTDQSFAQTDISTEALRMAETIDQYLLAHSHELSEILVKKYSFTHFAAASTLTVKFYSELKAKRSMSLAAWSPSRMQSQAPSVGTKDSNATAAVPSSSFTTPRRGTKGAAQARDDMDDDTSMHSPSTSSSSMMSTPSHLSAHGEDMARDDEDYEEDDESDMPVTPLSLSSLHDPLAAATHKENGASAKSVTALSDTESNKAQQTQIAATAAPPVRAVLSVSQQANRMLA